MKIRLSIYSSRLLRDLVFLMTLSAALGCLHHALRADRPFFIPPSNPAAAALPVVTAREVRDSLGSPQVALVDARPIEAFAKETIPNSLSLPLHSNWEEETLERLRKTPYVVVFCSDERCQVSREVALSLQARGVSGVKVFPGGMKVWKDMGFPVIAGE